MNNYSIKYFFSKSLPPKFIFDFISLHNSIFNIDFSIELFNKKYLDNPNGESLFICMYMNDKLVASRSFLNNGLLNKNEKNISLYQSCDSMIHKNHRGKGFFTKLTIFGIKILKSIHEDIHIFTFPNFNSKPIYEKFGWTNIGYFYIKLILFKNCLEKINIPYFETTKFNYYVRNKYFLLYKNNIYILARKYFFFYIVLGKIDRHFLNTKTMKKLPIFYILYYKKFSKNHKNISCKFNRKTFLFYYDNKIDYILPLYFGDFFL